MTKIIWTCWFQGRTHAPHLVERCLDSWERCNPGWELRCLDATTIEKYIPIGQYVDLERQAITAAALSDIVRILLLHEYGGVWVDATLYCNRPLDDWLPGVMDEGFFAFSSPGPDRPLSSWFLSAEPHTYLISVWCAKAIDYWSDRSGADEYFWFHYAFRELIAVDRAAAAAWQRVPRVSADGPHALLMDGLMFRPKDEVYEDVDWTTHAFKLTHRVPEGGRSTGSLLDYLLGRQKRIPTLPDPLSREPKSREAGPTAFASLKVSTENLGDHIQIIAGQHLLSRLGIEPRRFIDRDDELDSAGEGTNGEEPTGILLNGWFKSNHAGWPPHDSLVPVIYGFHIRLFQCPPLVSDASIAFFRRNEPIGCRDTYTTNLLRSHGVDAYTSNCLSLTFARRLHRPEEQTEMFVASRDERIRELLPDTLGAYTFVRHYSSSRDFAANMAEAAHVLETYRSRGRLIVTTLLHCALPAIAMGIPVVVFYPVNDAAGHASDRERFSSLESIIRVYRFDEIERVDWNPQPVDVSALKLDILERFYEMTARWGTPGLPAIGPIAPSHVCPPPGIPPQQALEAYG